MTALPTHLDDTVLFFLQLTIVLAACRFVGWIGRHLGQPAAVGEMIAGVLLGPSLFGLIFPELHDTLFPSDSMPALYLLSQLGLTLYMFIVGTEFEIGHFQQHGKTAASVSIVGIIAPFALGGLISAWLHAKGGFFPPNIPLYIAVLFMGASIAITAFPMLARIIDENHLAGTTLGSLTLAAGAINDVAAWCILALILSCSSGEWTSLFVTLAGLTLFGCLSLLILRPLLSRFMKSTETHQRLTNEQFTLILGLVIVGACFTTAIGIHSVFGAFLMGCAMPRGFVCDSLKKRLEPITLCLLVPLFFAYSGLRTRLDLVSTPWLLFVTAVVLIAACVGKGVACWAAARWTGESQGTALALGSLMNARGMMGLIILIVGKEHGIIGPELFSILVLMAILTTLFATPAFRWIRANYSLSGSALLFFSGVLPEAHQPRFPGIGLESKTSETLRDHPLDLVNILHPLKAHDKVIGPSHHEGPPPHAG